MDVFFFTVCNLYNLNFSIFIYITYSIKQAKEKRGWTLNSAGYLLGPREFPITSFVDFFSIFSNNTTLYLSPQLFIIKTVAYDLCNCFDIYNRSSFVLLYFCIELTLNLGLFSLSVLSVQACSLSLMKCVGVH